MERSLLIELIQHTKGTLDSIKKLTQLSRGRFSDREFGEFFYRMINKDIEKNDLVLNNFLNYIKAITPIREKGTVQNLIEEVLKKHQARLEEYNTKIFRNFEKDLPEPIVSDEQLGFILDSVLQYAITVMPPNGCIEFLTKSFALQKEMEGGQGFFKKNGRYIEILVAFTYYKKPMEQFGKELETPVPQKEVVPDLVFRLVDDIVDRNQGTIKLEFDETKAKTFISLKFPVERRKVVR
jgi:hypothetical protein